MLPHPRPLTKGHVTHRIEILVFDGCPNAEPARELVDRVVGELAIEADVRVVGVPDAQAAERTRFLGSPTIRVDGRDIEPGAEERTDYTFSCRVYASGGPDERWLRDACALAAAGIPPNRCGSARTAALSDSERRLYRWILTCFAEQGRPDGAEVRAQARELGLEPDAALALFAREDLIHLDENGELAVAYPFSGRPTRHRVTLGGGHEVYAMCAIDALGMAAMLGLPILVRSTDPDDGGRVTARVDTDGSAEWEPEDAVVSVGCGGCEVLNFFGTRAGAERYLEEHGETGGLALSIPDAIAVGRAVFGQALAYPSRHG